MKAVVVGGAAKDVGKTSVVEGIIAETRSLGWVAVKVTLFGPEEVSVYGGKWRLKTEFKVQSSKFKVKTTDTERFIAAGARQAVWLTAPRDQLVFALPSLAEALASAEHVIVESTSILEFWEPDLFVLVTGSGEMKPSTQRFLSRADVRVDGGVTPELIERVKHAMA